MKLGLSILALVASLLLVENCYAKVNIIDISRRGVFNAAVLRNQKPVIVYFTQSPCTQCKQILNDLENLARANEEDMYLARVDLDQNPDLRKEFQINMVPTTRTYYKGVMLREVEGPLAGGIRAIANNAIKAGKQNNPKK